MKIGLKTRFSDLEEVLKLYPDFVEFHFSDKDADYPFKPKTNYSIPAIIHLPELWNGYLIDICNIKEENQVLPLGKSIEVLQDVITKSEKFFKYFNNEENLFILHPGGMSFERDYPQNNIKRLENLADSLNKLKLTNSEILVENLPPYPWYFSGQWNSNVFMDAKEIDLFCKQTKRRICFDTAHSQLYCTSEKKDLTEQYKMLKKHVHHIQISDATGVDGEGIQIDEGDVDFDKFFTEIKDYDGTIVNEVWNGYANNFSGFKIANERIKKHLSKVK